MSVPVFDELPNFSILVTVLRNHYGSLEKLTDASGIQRDTLRNIELKNSLDPRYSTGLALITLAIEVFGEVAAKHYWEIH